MRVVIQDNYEKMCLWAANYIANRIKAHNAGPEKDRPFVLGLPTGSSPIGVYKELARMNKAGELSFANVVHEQGRGTELCQCGNLQHGRIPGSASRT